MAKTETKKDTERTEALKELKVDWNVKRIYKRMLKIMNVYNELEYLTDFKLDIQLYSANKSHDETARVWLTADKVGLGISLQLYSINLNDDVKDLTHKEALEVFNEYITYYALHPDEFKTKEGFTFNIQFEVSNR